MERRETLLLKIDNEFRDLIPPLTSEEYEQLEKNLLKEGCRDSLITWNSTIIDGHNRYEICTRHKIQFNTVEHAFNNRDEAKEWIIRNQFGRRNLSAYQRSELALQLKPLIQAKAKENLKTHTEQGYQNSDKAGKAKVDTTKQLAKIAGVSHDTIYKVEQIQKHAPEEVKQKVKTGEMSICQGYIATKAKVDTPKPKPTKEEKDKKARGLAEMERLYEECKADYKGPVQEIKFSISFSEFESIINTFIAEMTKYTFMGELFKSVDQEEKKMIINSLQNALKTIESIKNQIL